MVKFNFKLNFERKFNINFNINFNISFNHAHRKYVILIRKYALSVTKTGYVCRIYLSSADVFRFIVCHVIIILLFFPFP